MAGGNEEHDDAMEASEDNDDIVQSEQSECDDDDLDLGDMEYYDDANEYCSVHQNLKDDIRKALATYPEAEDELGIPSIQIDETRTNLKYISAVVLTFTLKDISEHLLELWDLVDTPAIIMEMDNIHRGEFRNYGHLPTITVTKHSSEGHFIVGEQLKNFALRLCRESFCLRTNESPETAGSFFADLYGKVKERLVRLSEYCVTCGEVLTSGGVLPSICERDLCMYQYTELHLFDGLSVPRVSPDVLSLLLFAFANANLSARRKDILTPAPPIKSFSALLQEAKDKRLEKLPRGDTGEFPPGTLFDQDKKGSTFWNFTVSNAVSQYSSGTGFGLEAATFSVLLENMPCPREFLASVSAYHAFRKSWPEMSNIVDWLVISNRSYLEMVPKPMKVDFLHTSAQYCFVSDTPAKQAEFDELVAANGGKTRFFFHGSPLENWHSIIRSGLKNMSGTKYQLVGAAYGKGIYLSPFLDFALGYASRVGHSMSRRMSGMNGELMNDRPVRQNCKQGECCETERKEDLSCVALVEVVDCPEAYAEKTDEIFVVEQDKWCSIRMLLLYRSSDINKLHDEVAKCWEKNGDDFNRGFHARYANRTSFMTPAAFTALAGPPPNPASQPSQAGAPPGAPPSRSLQFVYGPRGGPHPSSSGFMSYMMNKFGNWGNASTFGPGLVAGSGTTPGSGSGSGSGSSAVPGQPPTANPAPSGQSSSASYAPYDPKSSAEHKAKLLKKLEEQKKEWERRKAMWEEKMKAKASAASTSAASDAASSEPPTLGSKSSSSSSEGLVDLTKDEEEDKPGTSGLQKETEKERRARLRMALLPSEDGGTAEPKSDGDSGEWTMSEKWRSKKERRVKRRKGEMEDDDDKDKKDEDKKEKEKDPTRRKRSNSDPSVEVPKKTASSPSSSRKEDEEHKLTEEDFKILEMFADSDLGEDEVQVTKMVPGKKKKSTKQAEKDKKKKKEKEKGNDDETDEDIKVVHVKEKQKKAVKSKLNDDTNEKKVRFADQKDGGAPTGPTTRSKSASALATTASIVAAPTPSSFPSTSSAPLPSSFPGPSTLHSMPPPWSMPLYPTVPVRTVANQPTNSQQPPLPAATMQQMLQQSLPGRTAARAQQLARMQQLQQTLGSATSNPPPSGSVAGPPGASGSAAGGTISWLQSMGGMFSRRHRRRVTFADSMPGDLTTITDEQREQIYRVVRMFRNSGFEERVNRHMNREGEPKEEEEERGQKEDDADDEGDGSGDSMDMMP